MFTEADRANHPQAVAAADSPLAAYVVLLLLPVAVYVAFWVLHLSALAGVGFSLIVPSVVGSAVAALINAARA